MSTVYPSTALIVSSVCAVSLSLSNSVHPFSLAQSTADAPIFTPQEMPQSGSVCVCDRVCVCWKTICQSISLLCSDCQKLWVCVWNGCEFEWELMSLYGTALGDTKRVSFYYELRCKI